MTFKLVVREYSQVVEADIKKHIGQQDIAAVAGLDEALSERIVSRPETGQKQVFNVVWDPNNEELIIEISETAVP